MPNIVKQQLKSKSDDKANFSKMVVEMSKEAKINKTMGKSSITDSEIKIISKATKLS